MESKRSCQEAGALFSSEKAPALLFFACSPAQARYDGEDLPCYEAVSMSSKICPCGSKKEFDQCCGIYLSGKALAPHPEDLMRSRYVAFYRNDLDYLKKTWHPETYPEDLGSEEPSNWVGLEIIEASVEEDEGEVEFKARLIYDNKLEVLHEISYFDKIDGQWLYHSGDFENDGKPEKLSKSTPCPCGSGKKFGNCHFQK